MFKFKKISLFIIVSFLTLTFSFSAAAAKKVYINGMDLSKYLLTNITLKCVTIKFDAKGNMYIIAQGYNFKPSKATKATTNKPKADKLANKFYLVTFPKPAKVNIGYKTDLMINGKFVKRVYGNSGQIVFDITSSMKAGKNIVSFVSNKNNSIKSPRGSIKFAIARGYESKGTYIIKNLIWEVSRSSKDPKSSYFIKKVIKK